MHGSENHCETTRSLQICYLHAFNSDSIIPRSRTSTNWNDASSANGPLWVTRLLRVLLESVVSASTRLRSCWRRTFWAQCWNKDCVMWDVRQWLFWETRTVSHVCCYSVKNSNTHLIRLLCWRLNLTLQISQGSASTHFRWSGHFMHSFVKGFFRDNPSNFYWNRLGHIWQTTSKKLSLHSCFVTRCREVLWRGNLQLFPLV